MKARVDILILSYAKNDLLKELTIQTIRSLLDSEDPEHILFNILVIESNKELQPYTYEYTTTIYPKSGFGFHKYFNIGIRRTSNPYLCLCNNDLIFQKNWAAEIVSAMEKDPSLLSASPYCPGFHSYKGFMQDGPPVEGYFNVLTGWCIFVQRKIFDTIGLLDEKLTFWYSDADFCHTLLEKGVKNCLIPTAVVAHLGSESFKTMTPAQKLRLTEGQKIYYDYKWKHRSFLRFLAKKLIFKFKMLTRRDG